MALLTGHRERERGREGTQTNYAQDKQHADSSSSSNSRGSNSCCCNLLLIYVEIKNEQQESK